MTKMLLVQAVTRFFSGLLVMGLLLFVPAGTTAYPEGWRLMALLFAPMFLAGLMMLIRRPDMLRKRLNMKEKLGEQVQVILLSCMMFVSGFIAAGLSFRFGFCLLPQWISWAACAAFLLAYALYAQVLRENAFLSRTIEIQEDQRVVDTGLYAHVRHPMYSATILLFLSMPLILRSLAALIIFLAYPAIIAKRIRSEEAFLAQNLEGYADYQRRVRWRLVPFVW
ncbi:MAG: isoprenylcysteine carboxylmethyltransferase family protein [Clostridia bacterium]|nr:isoprenylcysteine carboxylmethyltransferase family protein [Clostridia bacterium]